MRRADLISNLETVKPALAVNQLVPLLTHFWFTGKRLMAFNDQIAISIPFQNDEIKGAVPAKLLELLRVKDGGTEVDVTSDGRGNLIVRRLTRRNKEAPWKPSKGQIRLAMLDPEFIFKMPEVERAEPAANGAIKDLIDGVDHCLLSVGSDTSAAEHLGVTFEKDPTDSRRVVLYSTDSSTLSRAFIRSTNAIQLPHRAIVPGLFCQQMLRLYRELSDKSRASFRIGSRQVREGVTDRFALFTAGPAVLYGRLLETRSPLDFVHVLGYHLPKQFEDKLVQFPDRLRGAIERAFIVCDAQRKSTTIKVEGGRLSLTSVSDNEEVKDDLPLKDHDNISVTLEPRFLRRATAGLDQILVAPLCVVLSNKGGSKLYLVSTQ
jgi:DNA polymerase III sliding clamp (beta) subunit (PCNA family)